MSNFHQLEVVGRGSETQLQVSAFPLMHCFMTGFLLYFITLIFSNIFILILVKDFLFYNFNVCAIIIMVAVAYIVLS